ncbi:hypothetical protein A3A38_00255 [Candidatus Kaiserbacteria bacterium RIFCSPLOWO2_01_FULL_53_17]|uniref:D,D-heptose 1,7-bisphosphate phosphatase n=1 Tax=Candidatus Kaiserbacteria bacterium RIFCSPLOWO2_01_FULL_53_17 TaxID=1798511 RepID=A0A1F6EGD9_9BACT|nr:MAG: hypothetical protein A3A38_00255 [Candidatus Kaiserbacteria bacterium RIFCSPLOWO2_01_FULL_53_17]
MRARRITKKRKALFLDRDGVINRSAPKHEYVTRIEEFEFLPQTFDTLRRLKDAGYDFYVITNQAGVARGQATHDQMNTLHEYLATEFEREGLVLHGVYMCPHQDEDDCLCRKPKPGLLLQAMQEHELDPADVVFVGDRETDMQAAKAAGVRGILIPGEAGISVVLDKLLE